MRFGDFDSFLVIKNGFVDSFDIRSVSNFEERSLILVERFQKRPVLFQAASQFNS